MFDLLDPAPYWSRAKGETGERQKKEQGESREGRKMRRGKEERAEINLDLPQVGSLIFLVMVQYRGTIKN